MAIGDFLDKLKPGERTEPEKFLALELTDDVVAAATWHVAEEKTEIVSLGTPVEWDSEKATTADLVQAVDATVSSAIEGLVTEPDKVIFGVPHGWTDAEGIVTAKRDMLRKVCRELDLKPLGFVVVTDSVLSYLKMQEGTPTTSILIQVTGGEIVTLLVRLGRIEATEVVGRSDDVVADVEEGISRFPDVDNLPSRIVVFNSMHNLDDVVQNLMGNDWNSKFKFLHIPKIEALAKDVVIRSIALAGGREVAKSIGFSVAEEKETSREPGTTILPVPKKEEKIDKAAEQEEDADIPAKKVAIPHPVAESDVVPVEDMDSFGFTVGGPSLPAPVEAAEEISPVAAMDPEDEMTPDTAAPTEPNDNLATDSSQDIAHPHRSFLQFPSFSRVALLVKKIRLPNLSLGSIPRLPFVGVGIAMLVVIATAGAAIWFLPKASVVVTATPKDLPQTAQITLSQSGSAVDPTTNTIPATVISQPESGSQTIETTGKKIVGTPAKGTVTVYNNSALAKTFAAGTVLSVGSLKYTFDSAVTVASASSSSSTPGVTTITAGKASGSVTAATIGDASNQPAGTQFTIASFSKDTYFAQNDTVIGGGTSQEVQVVAKADMDSLVKALTDQLVGEAQSSLQSSTGNGVGIYVVPDSGKVDSQEFSAKVGDQAKELTGTLSVTLQAFRYSTTDAGKLVDSAIEKSIPEGYVRTTQPPTVSFSGATGSASSGEVVATAQISVKLLPKINTTALASSLRGKSAAAVEEILKTIPGFESAKVQITPLWLPPRFKLMPQNPQNITVSIIPSSV